jgi:hypothetical protein
MGAYYEQARRVLEAAAPLIRADERRLIAIDLDRRAAGLDACASDLTEPGEAGTRAQYQLIATTLRNTGWALEHGDEAVNLAAPAPRAEEQ